MQGESAGKMFKEAKSSLLERPWAVDGLDALLARFSDASKGPHAKAMIFVDNAGSDVMLGMLPFARELLRRGTKVVLAANSAPSINDVTADELQGALKAAGEKDKVVARGVAEGTLRAAASGSGTCVIDLKSVTAEVAREAAGADLVVLEGMGRGIETNLWARFECESLKIGMVKHPEVAQALRGRMYDCVIHYAPPGGGGKP